MIIDSYFFIYIFANLFSVYTTYKFVRVFYSECKVTALIERMLYIGYIAIITCIHLFIDIPLVLLIANLIILFLLTLLYDSSLKKSILSTMIIFLTLAGLETIIAYLTYHISYSPVVSSEYNSILGQITVRILSYMFVLGVHGFKNVKSEHPMPNQYWLCLLSVPAGSLFMLVAILSNNFISDTLIVISIICALAINLFTFYLYDSIANLSHEKMMRQVMEAQGKYYERQVEMMKSTLDNFKQIRHDLKNKLAPLYELAESEKKDEFRTLLSELAEVCMYDKEYAASGNVAIDSIINFKLNKNPDVDIDVQVSIPNDLLVSTFDLAVVLGNMIDNALEAVNKAKDKWIIIRISLFKGVLIIEVINSYDGYINKSNKAYISRKQDKENHGLGLISIESTIKKYDGLMKITHDDKKFSTKVLMYV